MSDKEWERLKETFRKAGSGAPPRVAKRALTDRRRAILGMIVLYMLCGANLVGEWAHVSNSGGVARLGPFALTVIIVLVLGIGAPLAMRGTWGVDSASVVERISALERRHAGRRKLARLAAWAVAVSVAGSLALSALDGRWMRLVACGVSVGFAWLVLARIHRVIERDLREADQARDLLREAEPAAENADDREITGR